MIRFILILIFTSCVLKFGKATSRDLINKMIKRQAAQLYNTIQDTCEPKGIAKEGNSVDGKTKIRNSNDIQPLDIAGASLRITALLNDYKKSVQKLQSKNDDALNEKVLEALEDLVEKNNDGELAAKVDIDYVKNLFESEDYEMLSLLLFRLSAIPKTWTGQVAEEIKILERERFLRLLLEINIDDLDKKLTAQSILDESKMIKISNTDEHGAF